MSPPRNVRIGNLIKVGRIHSGNNEMFERSLKALLWNMPRSVIDPVWMLTEKARQMGKNLSTQEAERIIEESKIGPGVRKAEELGDYLKLSYEDRMKHDIRTIGSYDVDKRNRTLRAKRRARDRAAEKRLAMGATPRNRSLAQTKPWLDEGIGRTEWYRRRADERGRTDGLMGHVAAVVAEQLDLIDLWKAPAGRIRAVSGGQIRHPYT